MQSAVRKNAGHHETDPTGKTVATGQPVVSYDVRLKRELTQRQLVIAILRRVLRVGTLHVLDGLAIALVLFSFSALWSPFEALGSVIPMVLAIHLLSLNALSVYQAGQSRRDRRRLLQAESLAIVTLASIAAFSQLFPLDFLVLVVFGASTFVVLAFEREVVDQVVRHAYKRGFGLRRALLIGNLDEVGSAIERLRDDDNIDHYIVGHITAAGDPDPTALGTVETLKQVIEEQKVQEVIVSAVLSQAAMKVVASCCFESGAALFVIPPITHATDFNAEPLRVGRCALLRLHPGRLKLPGLLVKRVFDLTVAALALLFLTPLLLLIAIAIKIDSPGPIFFFQRRVGLGGRTFTIWKFRSMYVDSEARLAELACLNAYGDTRLFKLPNDPRITRVGQFLRRASLDELPQLLNVLTGDMSLVGPRPPLPSEVQTYEPHHFERLTVVPGITGPWQVGGRNLITDFESVVRMERAYIQSWSLLLDAKILWRTIKVVISGEGAY